MTEKEYLKRLGKQITKIRESKALTKEFLSHESGLTRMHIYRIEKGSHATSISILRKISKILGVTLSELVDIEK